MVTTQDPVAAGLVDSLARPGGNITGVTRLTRDLSGKRLELLKEVGSGDIARWSPLGPSRFRKRADSVLRNMRPRRAH